MNQVKTVIFNQTWWNLESRMEDLIDVRVSEQVSGMVQVNVWNAVESPIKVQARGDLLFTQVLVITSRTR